MAMDSYSSALQSRRGKTIDGNLLRVVDEIDSPHGAIDDRLGVSGSQTVGGERHDTTTQLDPSPQFDRESETHMDEHTSNVREGLGASPHPDWRSEDHRDEHTPPVGEGGPMGMPKSQSHGEGGGDLDAQIRGHIIGHTSENEAEMLKDMKPRSLGERAKMAAMRKGS